MTDLLISGGEIITVDGRYNNPEAVLVRDKTIFFVGDLEAAEAQFRPGGDRLDLDGDVLLPGFIDAHSHPILSAELRGAPVVDIRAHIAPTYDAVLAKIKRRVAAAQPGEHLLFFGLDPQLHAGLEPPTRLFLDEIAPDNPIAVQTSNLHALYLNSAAFAASGIGENTPTPLGGIIDRDADGRLTGKVAETTIFQTLQVFNASWGEARIDDEFCSFLQPFIENGITTTTDHLYLPYYRAIYERALARDWPLPRIAAYHQAITASMNLEKMAVGDDRLWMAGIKIHADGSPFVGNIWLSAPYLENETTLQKMDLRPGHTGHMNYQIEHIRDMVEAYFEQGWQISIHAQGDKTIDAVLDIFEAVLGSDPQTDHRCRLEHCVLMREDQIDRAMRLGVLCSFFINHITHWGGPIEDVLFGPERAAHYAPAGTAARAGMRISLHADTPMTDPSALALMQAGMTRRANDGRCLGAEECLDAMTALKSVTIDAAYQIRKEDVVGSITPGKHADFAVLSANPLQCAANDLTSIDVKQTYLAGKRVWRKDS